MTTLGLIGPGRVGRTLATLASAEGYPVGPVLSRNLTAARKAVREMRVGVPAGEYEALAEADLVLIAAPEPALPGVTRGLARAQIDWSGKVVLTTSGSCAPDWGAELSEAGAAVGSFFPLQTFQRPLRSLAGVYFVITGDPQAAREARTLAQALGATFALSGPRTRNQATLGVAAASDVLTAVFELAVRRFVAAGVRRKRAVEALRVLVARSLEDYERSGARSRPGPLLRSDAAGVRTGLEALAERDPVEAERHREALRLSLDILEIDDPSFAFLDGARPGLGVADAGGG